MMSSSITSSSPSSSQLSSSPSSGAPYPAIPAPGTLSPLTGLPMTETERRYQAFLPRKEAHEGHDGRFVDHRCEVCIYYASMQVQENGPMVDQAVEFLKGVSIDAVNAAVQTVDWILNDGGRVKPFPRRMRFA